MGNFSKWSKLSESSDPNTPLRVVLFVSRNKDNKTLPDFQERRWSFVSTKNDEELQKDFQDFVSRGVPGEFCRLYRSVNTRSNAKTQKLLQHALLDNEYGLATLPQRVAAFAAQKECALESNWLFDFDPIEGRDLDESIDDFVKDMLEAHNTTRTSKGGFRPFLGIELRKTPNGVAVIVNQRFDTRALLEKWTNVELKRDDMICIAWKRT